MVALPILLELVIFFYPREPASEPEDNNNNNKKTQTRQSILYSRQPRKARTLCIVY